ncbi:proton-translocating NADH-quinone oxidoreductase, chain M [Acidithiobacillus ferrivorans SS3]|uniref:Proton-translocating NADH-quinone oxidoreductase, chain M n=1 Tax=Acidithiobacillus ferrivorans SS3 TaxID=743299 RepID=G0JQJ1_9PROT|nr:NADH-quinone oxidoreductase subunit M [Acidithiobacillus ferrivorans]AEM48630.1 proton-translocating NADH-quinone oxidoreductase, chain M [Acidithiobacillus ferrivorans SS3]MBU2766335.1 NADH-quinone oxidoreductase subunit M [Acidithiobacillus ferrivorans]MBU2851319.1 NADH-quinone oxidoreductase subunit M [Acidithiobacillus ferrivorans]OFA15743.1 NADH-quinone oxidoreductase subunit M [Acidithiobacillus ferrivorans]
MAHSSLLSYAIWVPIVGGLLVLAVGDRRAAAARWLALLVSLAAFAVTILLFAGFDTHTAAMQFSERVAWIPTLNIFYHLGIDGISLWFILLTSLLTVLVIISSWRNVKERVAQFMAAFLIMEGMMIGVFCALDAILFYVFWEAMLIPMFLIIGVWGGPRRVYATIKFFLYTFLGSVLMLVALLYLYFHSGDSFGLLVFQKTPLGMSAQVLIFLAFFFAFAVKIPMWPVHTWLPDAHVEAPTGGSVILAAVMLKMGAYGFLRLSLPIVPDASHKLAWLMIALSLIAIIYVALVAIVQEDMKKLIAYSSIAHMGFVTLGFFVFDSVAIEGGIIQMLSHGFVSAAMFLCVGVLYDRMHTRNISAYGGVANVMPIFAALMMLFAMANVGLPGTSGFVGEFMVVLGTYQVSPWAAILAATGLITGASYTLWLFKRVIFGAITHTAVAGLKDLDGREIFVLATLAAFTLLLGLWPAPFLDIVHNSVQHLVTQVSLSKIPA